MQITNIVFRPPTSPVLAPSLQAALRAGLARDDLGALRRRAGSPRRAEGQRLMKQPWQAPLRQRQCLAFGFDFFCVADPTESSKLAQAQDRLSY
jgi:hypothetical protein